MRPRLWTVGHSNRSIDELLEVLGTVPIRRVVDVRSVPQSRRHPQFGSDALAFDLERRGLVYRHAPELGGLRKPLAGSVNTALPGGGFRGYADHMQTETFADGLGLLIAEARDGNTAVLCAEKLPRDCHRLLLADAAAARGVEVLHLLAADRVELHRFTPLARVVNDRVTYPGLL